MIIDLCADWRFFRGDNENAVREDLDDDGWRVVDLPHDWSIEGPFDERCDLWNGYLPKGVGWYRKPLILDRQWNRKRIFLEFEGVFRKSMVFVNGKRAGAHVPGYTAVIYDITPYVRFNGAPNCLVVKVDNPAPHDMSKMGGQTHIASYTGNNIDESCEGWWYEGCGIYRPVRLLVTDPLYLDHWGTFIRTTKITSEHAVVDITVCVKNAMEQKRSCRLRVAIVDAAGNRVATISQDHDTDPYSASSISLATEIVNPRLWSVESPHLYTAHAELIDNDRVIDNSKTTFGVRFFEFTSHEGFYLNGERLQLRGANIHQDFGGLGCALPARAHEKNVEVLKGMGCNIVRIAHHDGAGALLDACDHLGLLAWVEHRYLTRLNGEVDSLIDLIRRNRNHPSIICWGLANTAGGEDQTLTDYLRKANDIAHREDPSRPTAVALEGNTNGNANGFAKVTDIVGYNGGGMGIDDADHVNYPERKMLISEFSSGRCARGIYEEQSLGRESKFHSADGRVLQAGARLFDNYAACLATEKEWTHVAKRPWLNGGIIWSGIEYWGETCGWPVVSGQFGVLDLCRFPKDSYYYFLQEWTTAPMIHVFPHWTWPGKEGKKTNLWCYTTCDEAELLVNGVSQGVKPRRPLTHIEWTVGYEPGWIEVRGLKKGEILARKRVDTAIKPVALRMEADRPTIKSDGQDLAFITIGVHDANGTRVPCDILVHVEVSGDGSLRGLCNGNPTCHTVPSSTQMRTFSGILLAIVAAKGKCGDFGVKASAVGLEPAVLTIRSVMRSESE